MVVVVVEEEDAAGLGAQGKEGTLGACVWCVGVWGQKGGGRGSVALIG